MPRYDERLVGVIPIVVGSGGLLGGGLSQPLHIDRIHMCRKLNLKLTGQITNANPLTDADPENPQSLLRGINVHANGRLPKQIRGEELYFMNGINRGVKGQRLALAGNEAANTWDFSVDIEVNFQSIRMKPKAQTNLASWSFSSLFIEILWGTIADITSDANVTLDNAQVSVIAYYDKTDLSKLPANIERNVIENITGANTNFEIDLDLGTLYRLFCIKSEDQGRPVDNIINYVSLKIGDLMLYDRLPWAQLQADNKYNYQQETWEVGYAILDFPKTTGDWNRLLDLRFMDVAKFIFDVNAGTSPQIILQVNEINPGYLK